MTESSVGTLRIRLIVPRELEARSAELKHTVERELITRVLEALEQLLHAALGATSVIRVRRLALNWSLAATDLATADTVARLAGDLARSLLDELARASQAERVRPRPDAIAAFVDDSHAMAACLADAADGLPPHWIHRGATPEAGWERAASEGALPSVVSWLVRMERLERALALAPARTLVLLEALPAAAPLVALVHARRAEARGRTAEDRRRAADGAADASRVVDLTRDAPGDAAASASAAAAALAARETAVAAPVDTAAHHVVATSAAHAAGPAVASPAAAATPEPAAVDAIADEISVPTDAAGLFYLVGRALEIELAERLWAAGLPEGDVLAYVASALLGDVADPAWRWFGGIFDSAPALPTVPAWAVTEICDGMQLALGQRLVRFGASLTPAALGARLDHLALAFPPPVPLPPPLARVASWGAAALAYITCVRLDVPPSATATREVIARPGTLVRLPDELRIVIAASQFSHAHRRAGLDLDPGHIPWLHRRLCIELVGGLEI